MRKPRRYHPLLMLYDLWKLLRNSVFFVLYLYVIKAGSESAFIHYGRVLFLVASGLTLISILFKWLTHKYEWDEQSFHLYKGMFSKTERTVPYSRIQNVNRHTSVFHRIFNVTSVHFESGMAGEDSSVGFKVISQQEAALMEAQVARVAHKKPTDNAIDEDPVAVSSEPVMGTNEEIAPRTVHFKPEKRDTLKASVTSLSFLLLIPLLVSLYSQIIELFPVNEQLEGIWEKLADSWWMVTVILLVLILASAAFGVVRTFLRYGKYEISSDPERIYISKGIIEEAAFSIAKGKVQAVEIIQSPLKRLLGLAEVKLISAGSLGSGDGSLEVNSLYPFLPVQRAYEMVSEILPAYEITPMMNRLPLKSIGIRMLRPSWLWIIATLLLVYFKPAILSIELPWWILSAALFLLVLVFRLLDFYNTRYLLKEHYIQLKKGSLTTSLFVTKRDKIIEVCVSQNRFQKMLGLASIETINRAKPVQHNGLDDVPVELAASFYTWYEGRRKEICME